MDLGERLTVADTVEERCGCGQNFGTIRNAR